jgi:5'-nucleotidase
MVVCLSHLGYKPSREGEVGDFELAKQSKNIDLILGGHSHTLLSKPVSVYNSDGKQLFITQNAYAGVRISRIDCFFSNAGELIFTDLHTNKILKKQA